MAHVLLLLGDRARHGYEVAETLRMWEFEGVTTSLVYRELARLEEEGLVQSFWQASQARGPARHMYELTPAGRDALARCADDVRGLIGHLTGFLSQVAALDGIDPAPAGASSVQSYTVEVQDCTVVGEGSPPEPELPKVRRRRWRVR